VHSQVDTNDLKLTLTGGRPTTTVAAGRVADALHSAGQAVLADFYQYFAQISADRRANPRDDLATVIATSQVDGRPISEFEAMSYYVIVATAGHDTTSSTTAGGDADVM
jgi:cytochrome P450